MWFKCHYLGLNFTLRQKYDNVDYGYGLVVWIRVYIVEVRDVGPHGG